MRRKNNYYINIISLARHLLLHRTHFQAMRMMTARLEIFADGLDSSPHLSRSLPAALDGLIDNKAFHEFADELDILLEMLDTDHQRVRNRYRWLTYGYLFLLFGLCLVSRYYINLSIVWSQISVIYMASTWQIGRAHV